MAKKPGKKSTPALEIRLVLTTDEYTGAWKKAQRQTATDAGAIDKAISAAANKIALKFFAMNNMVKLAERGFKGLISTAERLEKEGRGDEGTKAVTRLAKAWDDLGTNLARAVVNTSAAKFALGGLTTAIEGTSKGLLDWKGSLELVRAAWDSLVLGVINFNNPAPMSTDEVGARAQAAMERLDRAAARDVIGRAVGVARDAVKSASDRQPDRGPGILSRERFLADRESTINAFIASWDGGFNRLGELMNSHAERISAHLRGMTTASVAAFGDMFEAIGFTGPLVERVFGQSEKAARKFQAAQLALVGGLSAVKAAQAIADAHMLVGDKDFLGAGAKIAAAAAYTAAAGLAGVAAHQTLAAGSRTGTASQFTDPSRFEDQPRKFVTVVIENLIGGEEFVRDTLIPALNDAVGDGVTVIATSSQAANQLEPGRP